MTHLSPETLARLADAAPSTNEAHHLAECAVCTAEVAAYRAQLEALADLPALQPAGEAWSSIEARLLAEALIEPAAVHDGSRSIPWMRIAATLLLFLGGTAFGSFVLPQRGGASDPGGTAALTEILDSSGANGAATEAITLDEAEAYVRQTQELQLDALLLYREVLEASGGMATVGDPYMRVAMLDHLLAAAEIAVREAPADPFFNGLFVNTIAERQLALSGLEPGTAELP